MAGRILNVGIVGYGYWGPNLVRNFSENKDVTIIYVCDLDKKKLGIVEKKYPKVKVTQDYNVLLSDPKIDAILIASPTSTHFSLAKHAILAGKHIWVEKPFTQTSDEAKELVELAQKKKKIIFVDHIFLYTETVHAIKEFISRKRLGRIYYFDSTRINLGLFQPDTNVIWDLAPHDISIMLYLMNGTPRSVSAFANSHVMRGIEDTAHLYFKFRGKKSAHIKLSWLSPVKIRQTLIAGTKKMVLYDDLENTEKIKVYDYGVSINKNKTSKELSTSGYQYRTGDIVIPSIIYKETLINACNAFVESIKTRKQPISDGRNGYIVVKIIEAAQESLKNGGRHVEINSINE